jgi:hypothetical protein
MTQAPAPVSGVQDVIGDLYQGLPQSVDLNVA